MADKCIVRGGYLLTNADLLPDAGFISDGAILVDGNEIKAAGSFEDLKSANPNAVVEGSAEAIVLPGLVNAHTHGRGLPVSALGVLDGHVDPFLVDYLTVPPLDAHLDTLYENLRLLRSGVTTVLHSGLLRTPGEMRKELDGAIRAYRDCGMRVSYAVPMQDVPGLVYRDEENLFDSLDEPLKSKIKNELGGAGFTDAGPAIEVFENASADYSEDPAVRIFAGPNGPDWASDDLWGRVVELTEKHETGIQSHCSESAAQRDASVSIHGIPPVARLERLGVLGPKTSLAHCVWVDEYEQELLAEHKTTVCTLTSSNMRLAQGVAPIASMLEKGVPVAIGTDSFSLASDDDYLAEIRLAGIVHRMPRDRGLSWFPRAPELLRMATTKGAAAAGFNNGVGKLVEGGPADIVILDRDTMVGPYLSENTPVPEAILAFASRASVSCVIIAGEPVYKDGRFLKIDAREITERLREVAMSKPDPAFESFADAVRDLRPAVENHYRNWKWGFSPKPDFKLNTSRTRSD